jgi:hypothetical protein
MHATPPRLLVALAVGTLLLGACGTSGGDDASTTKADATTTSPTADETTATTEDGDATEPTDTTDTPVGDGGDEGGEICGPLKVLSDFDAESARITQAGDWPDVQAFFVDHTDEVLAAYDDAIALDSEVTDDLEQLRDVTDTTVETAADADSLEDFSTKLLAKPGIMEAGAAGIALDDFAQEHCGFSTGGN